MKFDCKSICFWVISMLVCVPWASLLHTGIIAAIAFCPTHTGMLATGSYSRTTAIYREDNMELLYILHGQEGGVTNVSEQPFVIHYPNYNVIK